MTSNITFKTINFDFDGVNIKINAGEIVLLIYDTFLRYGFNPDGMLFVNSDHSAVFISNIQKNKTINFQNDNVILTIRIKPADLIIHFDKLPQTKEAEKVKKVLKSLNANIRRIDLNSWKILNRIIDEKSIRNIISSVYDVVITAKKGDSLKFSEIIEKGEIE